MTKHLLLAWVYGEWTLATTRLFDSAEEAVDWAMSANFKRLGVRRWVRDCPWSIVEVNEPPPPAKTEAG